METLKKFSTILTNKNKIQSVYLLIFILIGVFFEMLSLGLILPILTTLSNENNIQLINFTFILETFNFETPLDRKNTIIFFVIGLIIIYLIKTIFLNFLTWYQSKYINFLVAEIKFKLFQKYIYQDYTFHL